MVEIVAFFGAVFCIIGNVSKENLLPVMNLLDLTDDRL